MTDLRLTRSRTVTAPFATRISVPSQRSAVSHSVPRTGTTLTERRSTGGGGPLGPVGPVGPAGPAGTASIVTGALSAETELTRLVAITLQEIVCPTSPFATV